jgi:hypothetical protein
VVYGYGILERVAMVNTKSTVPYSYRDFAPMTFVPATINRDMYTSPGAPMSHIFRQTNEKAKDASSPSLTSDCVKIDSSEL